VADFYTDTVLEHFRNPRNSGELEAPDATGDVGNPVCGDLMRITLKINPETEVIEDIRFKTFGCGAAIATSSIITEMVKGKTIEEALKISNKDVIAQLGGLPPVKIHCSVLAEEGIVAALTTSTSTRRRRRRPIWRRRPSCWRRSKYTSTDP
jgi:nitrogen fixation NifU-like protein